MVGAPNQIPIVTMLKNPNVQTKATFVIKKPTLVQENQFSPNHHIQMLYLLHEQQKTNRRSSHPHI